MNCLLYLFCCKSKKSNNSDNDSGAEELRKAYIESMKGGLKKYANTTTNQTSVKNGSTKVKETENSKELTLKL